MKKGNQLFDNGNDDNKNKTMHYGLPLTYLGRRNNDDKIHNS